MTRTHRLSIQALARHPPPRVLYQPFKAGHFIMTPSATLHPHKLRPRLHLPVCTPSCFRVPLRIGSAIYIFGPTGPSFGVFQVSLDTKVVGAYNASTTLPTYDTLLFLTTQLDPSTTHQLVITNQVEGAALALDYIVVVGVANGEQGQPAGIWPSEPAVEGDNSSGALVGGLLGGLAALVCRTAFQFGHIAGN